MFHSPSALLPLTLLPNVIMTDENSLGNSYTNKATQIFGNIHTNAHGLIKHCTSCVIQEVLMKFKNIFLFFCCSFNLFDNPVLWKKTQHKEESQINLMSNIYKPFVTSDRFSVSFMETKPTYKLELTIMGKFLAHSGVYLS